MFKKGDRITCKNSSGYDLTIGSVYKVSKDEEAGIFANRPFVTIADDNNVPRVCHASRFESLEGGEEE